ncbi:MAG: DUF4062 domain-containing protein [Ignavibacteriaceae bacterium]|nr:DUF4062 domain-containing protein [Ignavibacteriaceae bacterium]
MQPLKIFVSSTINDLHNERKAAFRAIEKVGAYPVMSEKTIEAQSRGSVEACLKKVIDSDVYVLIIGGRYGWQPQGKESITELEFKTAKENGKQILVFTTGYEKEILQKDFEARVGEYYFWKKIDDAYHLESELEKSLLKLIEEKGKELFSKSDTIYTNLVRVSFPEQLYSAKLKIDRTAVELYLQEKKQSKYKLSPQGYAKAALESKAVYYLHDWIVWKDRIFTFRNLEDPMVGLTHIIDRSSIEILDCKDFYNSSEDHLYKFKFLLKMCLESKLFKLRIKWYKDEKSFVFLPVKRDHKQNWLSMSVGWTKEKRKVRRKVVDVKRYNYNNKEFFKLKCLAFQTGFECFDDEWYLLLKPNWVFLRSNFSVHRSASKDIKWLKKNERNMHVLNHFMFIVKYLQNKHGDSLFHTHGNDSFLIIRDIYKFEFLPSIPDSEWNKDEDKVASGEQDGNIFE